MDQILISNSYILGRNPRPQPDFLNPRPSPIRPGVNRALNLLKHFTNKPHLHPLRITVPFQSIRNQKVTLRGVLWGVVFWEWIYAARAQKSEVAIQAATTTFEDVLPSLHHMLHHSLLHGLNHWNKVPGTLLRIVMLSTWKLVCL